MEEMEKIMGFGAILGGIAKVAVPSLLGLKGASNQNKANKSIANNQQEFQERMARNKHTYEVQDLKNAGLNPILSAHSGAGTPAGASIPAVNEIEPGINSARSVSETSATIKKILDERKAIKAQTKLNHALKFKAEADGIRSLSSAKNQDIHTKANALQIPRLINQAKAEMSPGSAYAHKVRLWTNTFGGLLGNANSAKSLQH